MKEEHALVEENKESFVELRATAKEGYEVEKWTMKYV